ncbi:multidrug transporter [Alteromonas sp. 1_MG-2023]|uniref:multidrug transporter n=1 Tax=Alteromonas sp. 1_MG-2023 TaxID=3062669 RepID=UPI0026E3145D|nr:multidrug transporter [Alteromonas sp. 1_MG-2023]MDO6568624.1 multidrug transporter [Alteromonas sp. 1_MG-2023]
MSWVFYTLGAVIMQTVRNALQSKLSAHVDTVGVTLSRFLFAPPIALVYLIILHTVSPQPLPSFDGFLGGASSSADGSSFSLSFIAVVLLASVLQIAATAFMVVLFKQKNFAIGAGLAKSEALVAGVLGMLFFGSHLTLLGWIGIGIGGLAVFVLSSGNKAQGLSLKTLLIGIACGTCFALTSLFVREASHMLAMPFVHSAAWVLLWVLCIQALGLSTYILLTQPQVFKQLFTHLPHSMSISAVSCLGSICWFTAMALQHVALVKTLGQLEVLLTLLLAHHWLKNKVTLQEIVGLLMIAVAAVLVMWA